MATLVGDFIIERLGEWGIHRIYGYPGDGINGLMGAMSENALCALLIAEMRPPLFFTDGGISWPCILMSVGL